MKQYWILGKGWIGLALSGAVVLIAGLAIAGQGAREQQFGPGGPQAVGAAEAGKEGAGQGKESRQGRRGKAGRHGRAEKRGKGEGREGRGEMRGRLLFGSLSASGGSNWTISPEIPPHMQERAEAAGRELPELPDTISFKVSSATKYYFNSAEGQADDFAEGARVVVKLDKPWKEEGASAEAISDPETAREFIMDKMGGGRGMGPAGADGQEGRGMRGRGRRPAFGIISALSADSMTITPEVPDFISAKAQELGRELPADAALPPSISISLDSETKYVTNAGEKGAANPFKVGDKVAVLARRGKDSDSPRAIVVSDYATAEARMDEAMQRGPEGGEGRRKGGREGRRGRHAGTAAGGPEGEGCHCAPDCDCRDK
jgi:hypothetical protein